MRVLTLLFCAAPLVALDPKGAVLYFDFSANVENLAKPESGLRMRGARQTDLKHDVMQPSSLKALEFRTAFDVAETDLVRSLEGAQSATIGGWFYTRRKGEQILLARGIPEISPHGDRFFRPEKDWVNFVLGTDQRGFLFGTI